MSVVVRAFNPNESPHQMGGIYAINDRIKNDRYTFKFVQETGPLTIPILKAIEWITRNCEGWRVTSENTKILTNNVIGDGLEILSNIRGMRKPPAYKADRPYIDEHWRLRREAVDAYELVMGLGVLTDTPNDLAKVTRIEQIMPFAHIRWPAYAVLWDAVHRHPHSRMGGIRQWVLDDIERLGLGIPTVGQKLIINGKFAPGRPPVVIHPTSWGIRLVQLGDSSGEQFHITEAMRIKSRRNQSKIVPKKEKNNDVFNEKYLQL